MRLGSSMSLAGEASGASGQCVDLAASVENRLNVLAGTLLAGGQEPPGGAGQPDQAGGCREEYFHQRQALEIARARYQAGLSSELDVAQAQAQLATTEAGIPQLETSMRQAIHQLGKFCWGNRRQVCSKNWWQPRPSRAILRKCLRASLPICCVAVPTCARPSRSWLQPRPVSGWPRLICFRGSIPDRGGRSGEYRCVGFLRELGSVLVHRANHYLAGVYGGATAGAGGGAECQAGAGCHQIREDGAHGPPGRRKRARGLLQGAGYA